MSCEGRTQGEGPDTRRRFLAELRTRLDDEASLELCWQPGGDGIMVNDQVKVEAWWRSFRRTMHAWGFRKGFSTRTIMTNQHFGLQKVNCWCHKDSLFTREDAENGLQLEGEMRYRQSKRKIEEAVEPLCRSTTDGVAGSVSIPKPDRVLSQTENPHQKPSPSQNQGRDCGTLKSDLENQTCEFRSGGRFVGAPHAAIDRKETGPDSSMTGVAAETNSPFEASVKLPRKCLKREHEADTNSEPNSQQFNWEKSERGLSESDSSFHEVNIATSVKNLFHTERFSTEKSMDGVVLEGARDRQQADLRFWRTVRSFLEKHHSLVECSHHENCSKNAHGSSCNRSSMTIAVGNAVEDLDYLLRMSQRIARFGACRATCDLGAAVATNSGSTFNLHAFVLQNFDKNVYLCDKNDGGGDDDDDDALLEQKCWLKKKLQDLLSSIFVQEQLNSEGDSARMAALETLSKQLEQLQGISTPGE